MYKQKNMFPLFLAAVLLMLPAAAAEKNDTPSQQTITVHPSPISTAAASSFSARFIPRSERSAARDLSADSDTDALAHFVQTINFGLTVQASTGATRQDLLCVVAAALQAWPKNSSPQNAQSSRRR